MVFVILVCVKLHVKKMLGERLNSLVKSKYQTWHLIFFEEAQEHEKLAILRKKTMGLVFFLKV